MMMMMMKKKGSKCLAMVALFLATANCIVPPSKDDLNGMFLCTALENFKGSVHPKSQTNFYCVYLSFLFLFYFPVKNSIK